MPLVRALKSHLAWRKVYCLQYKQTKTKKRKTSNGDTSQGRKTFSRRFTIASMDAVCCVHMLSLDKLHGNVTIFRLLSTCIHSSSPVAFMAAWKSVESVQLLHDCKSCRGRRCCPWLACVVSLCLTCCMICCPACILVCSSDGDGGGNGNGVGCGGAGNL